MLWSLRKPDWRGSKRLLSMRWVCNWEATIRSRILAMKGRLEMGRKLLRLSKSTGVFLGTGVTAAILNAAGTIPQHKESFIILRTTEPREAKHDLNSWVGIGSIMEVATFIRETSLLREARSREENSYVNIISTASDEWEHERRCFLYSFSCMSNR